MNDLIQLLKSRRLGRDKIGEMRQEKKKKERKKRKEKEKKKQIEEDL